MKIHTYKGTTYFSEYSDARTVRDNLPGSRIVEYGRGFAVQIRKSGPYFSIIESDRMERGRAK